MTEQYAYPTVVNTLLTIAQGLGDVRVVRGRDTSSAPGNFIMVGVRDVDPNLGWDNAGTFDQEFQTFGTNRVETGSVNILALSRDGNGDADAACTALFALVEDLTSAVRADPSLALTGTFDYLLTKVQTGNVNESQNDAGAMAALTVAVGYQARI